jgi:tRNA pseudouridine55 synthase
VRALARDLGARLGVPAHLAALRRTESGAYSLEDAVPLEALAPSSLRTGIAAVRGVPLVPVDAAAARALAQGKRVHSDAAFTGTGLAHLGEELVALVHLEDGLLVVERGFGGELPATAGAR